MRRRDKEITDRALMESVIRRARVCRLAICDRGRPYVVPMCFGYRDGALYFHGAKEGMKVDILRRNNNVCVEFDVDTELVTGDEAAKFTMKYRSVIAFGKAVFIEDLAAKREALDILMSQYSEGSFEYPEPAVRNVGIFRVDVESMTGKQSGHPTET